MALARRPPRSHRTLIACAAQQPLVLSPLLDPMHKWHIVVLAFRALLSSSTGWRHSEGPRLHARDSVLKGCRIIGHVLGFEVSRAGAANIPQPFALIRLGAMQPKADRVTRRMDPPMKRFGNSQGSFASLMSAAHVKDVGSGMVCVEQKMGGQSRLRSRHP